MGTLCYCARLQHVPRFILLVHRAKTGCKTFYLWPMPDYYEYFQWQISKKNLGIKIWSFSILSISAWDIAFHLQPVWMQTLVVISSESCQRSFPKFCAPSSASYVVQFEFSWPPYLRKAVDVDLLELFPVRWADPESGEMNCKVCQLQLLKKRQRPLFVLSSKKKAPTLEEVPILVPEIGVDRKIKSKIFIFYWKYTLKNKDLAV